MSRFLLSIALCTVILSLIQCQKGAAQHDEKSGGSSPPRAAIDLRSKEISLPASGESFKGTGAKLLNQHCLMCHSTEYLNDQPPLSKEGWTKELQKMRKAYGAPIGDADIEALVQVLYKRFGAPLDKLPLAPELYKSKRY